tara:strand:- start:3133 stop:3384 length:252 start_codon:yes stop_codon:yes gene_type:complete
MSGHNKKAASAESFIKAAQLFHEKKQLIKGIKPQGKPVCRQRQALNPIIGIDPRVEVLNLDPAEKGGISSTFNFQYVLLTSQN